MSGKNKIRLALITVAFISLGTAFLSLSYLNRMAENIEQIAGRDAQLASLGEEISIQLLDARRQEKNYIIYFDTLYINNNRAITGEMLKRIEEMQETVGDSVTLHTISLILHRYRELIEDLKTGLQDDPRALYRMQQQIINYERELRELASKQKIKPEELPGWTGDVNLSILSASTKLSTDKARLLTELTESGDRILVLAKNLTEKARISFRRNSQEGISYATKAQRNTLTLLLIATLLLTSLIIRLPQRIFQPARKLMRNLQAIGRGESDTDRLVLNSKDEFGDLSKVFQQAVNHLHTYNEMKKEKLITSERRITRVLEEMQEGVFILSADHTLIYINQAAKNYYDIRQNLVGKPLKQAADVWEQYSEALDRLEGRKRQEISVKGKRASMRKRSASIIPITTNTGKTDSIVIVIK